MGAGFLIGGVTGPRLVLRLPVRALRVIVSLCGLALAVKLGAAACRSADMRYGILLELPAMLVIPFLRGGTSRFK